MFDFCDILGGAEPKNESHPIELISQPYTRDIIANLFPKFGVDRTCLIFVIFLGGAEPKNECHQIELILQPYTPDIITNLFLKLGVDRTCLIFVIFWVGRSQKMNVIRSSSYCSPILLTSLPTYSQNFVAIEHV